MERLGRTGYQFPDVATQLYLAVVGVLIALFHGERIAHGPWLVTAHGLAMVVVHLLVRRASRPEVGWFLTLLRHFYPVLLFTALYRESEYLNQMFVSGYLDAEVIRIEAWLFGFQPSLVFMDRLPWLWVSETFYAAYFSYYAMIAGLSLFLYWRDRAQFIHFLSVITFLFYVCYLCFIVLPVIGPRVFFGEVAGYTLPASLLPADVPACPAAIQQGFFYGIMDRIYDNVEGAGGSIPSSHVAVAVCMVWFSFRYARPIRYPHLVVVVWLCLATVYCRYHYAVDVFTGLAAAAVLIPLGHWAHRRFPRERPG